MNNLKNHIGQRSTKSKKDTLPNTSSVKTIASSGVFKIELFKEVGKEDYLQLIKISKSLKKDYGEKAVLTPETIKKYFNKSGSLPFIAKFGEEIIGYIIGVPLEELSQEPWTRVEENFGKKNTLYTYAFVMQKEFKKNGYAKILKRVFLSWALKKDELHFITGHVIQGVANNFSGKIKIINQVDNWQGTGKVFEYYRRYLLEKDS